MSTTTRIAVRSLQCGMPLITEVMSGMKSAAITWLLPAGCAHDPVHQQGMAAMWSELLLRGAGSRLSREFADAMDLLGAGKSVSGGTFSTAISATLIGSRLDAALPLLVDMVRAPRMDEDAIAPSRDLCIQSLESLKDNPQDRAHIAARERHLPSPLNRSGMGTIEGLSALTRGDLLTTWRRVATPGGSYFAAAGAIDPDALAARLDQLLEGWTGRTADPALERSAPRGYAHEADETNQVQIVVMHDAPLDAPEPSSFNAIRGNVESRRAMLERIVMSVLSGGMSGRLFSEVREKRGLCYSVSAGYRGDQNYGMVSAYVGTTPERAQESLDVLLAELQRINTPAGRITAEEFQRAIIGLKSGLIFSGESTSARAHSLASDMRRLGRPRSLDEIAQRIDTITLDEVNGYLTTRKLGTLTVQTVGPSPLKTP
jgi:predicted Zn-dependent peptidase